MISAEVKRLCDLLGPEAGDTHEEGPYIAVEQLTSRFGAFYEKVRTLVDYKEAHIIRRSTIRRILKRQLYIERMSDNGKGLLKELVSSGYLPNNRVPEVKGVIVQNIVHKWMLFRREGVAPSVALDFAAIEIERFLFPDELATCVVDSFFASAESSVVYQPVSGDKTLITYAACRRSLLNEDQAGLVYALLLRAVPEILSVGNSEPYLAALAPKVIAAIRTSERVAKDPLVWKAGARLKNRALYYAVLLEVFRSYGKGAEFIFDDEEKLRTETRTIIEKKQRQQRRILRVSGKRAVIYLLLTKIILGVLLELPYEHFILGSENYLALATNGLFHPILLFMMVAFHQSDKRGIQKVVDGVVSIVKGEPMQQVFIRPPIGATTFFFVVCFYIVLFAVTFGAILSGLIALHFNIVSIILFFVFLTLVSYFGIRIRATARRWEPAQEKPSTFSLLWDLFTFPIIRTGRWFSLRFSTVNVFVLFMDFLVEVPFKAFLGIFDASLSFIKEHRVETY